MLLRFGDPFRELDRMTDELWGQRAPAVPMEAVRRDDTVVVDFDLPGVDQDAIDLTVERDMLTVRVERQPQRKEGDEVLAAERRYGTFSRQLFLGDTLDSEHIAADYHDGVLTVTIPVRSHAQARKVAIGAAPSQPAIETTGEPA